VNGWKIATYLSTLMVMTKFLESLWAKKKCYNEHFSKNGLIYALFGLFTECVTGLFKTCSRERTFQKMYNLFSEGKTEFC